MINDVDFVLECLMCMYLLIHKTTARNNLSLTFNNQTKHLLQEIRIILVRTLWYINCSYYILCMCDSRGKPRLPLYRKTEYIYIFLMFCIKYQPHVETFGSHQKVYGTGNWNFLQQRCRLSFKNGRAKSTVTKYKAGWEDWVEWCAHKKRILVVYVIGFAGFRRIQEL